MIREFVEFKVDVPIGELIARLSEIKATLPPDATNERVSIRGDYNFGHHILVTYLRPETPEEIECDLRAMRFASTWSECRQSVYG